MTLILTGSPTRYGEDRFTEDNGFLATVRASIPLRPRVLLVSAAPDDEAFSESVLAGMSLCIRNSGIDPYADSPERIGKTSDYEGQSIMKWAAEHGQKVVRLRISTAFDKETPMEPNVIYTVPAPAFSAEIEEHVEYRDDGTSVIRAIGTAVPNLQVYRLQFIMHEMDMSKAKMSFV